MLRRLVPALGVLAILLLATPAAGDGAPAASGGATRPPPLGQQPSPDEQLAEKFAPIVMLKAQTGACDRSGEAYFPSPVGFLFNNPDVMLRAMGDDQPVLKRPVTAADLPPAGPKAYLDLPGNPRRADCVYERYFKQEVAKLGLKPTTYAHIVYDPVGRQIWVEYWSYYYFNDWNNTHESDWEMLMVGFNASSPAEALRQTPARLAFAQHGGGELANWNDAKVQKDGDHVIAYVSAGSHATYYGASTYIGWGADGSGFGCDITTGPHDRVPLAVTLIPTEIDPTGPLAWALYTGSWGQLEPAVYDGPTGPNTDSKWTRPAEGIAHWRHSSLTVPGATTFGPGATDLFCTMSTAVSRVGIALGVKPWETSGLVLAVLAAVALAVWRTWPFTMEALDVYGIGLRPFLGIGLLAIPIGVIFNGVYFLAIRLRPVAWGVNWLNDTTSGRLIPGVVAGGVQQAAMALLIAPAVIYATRQLRRGERPTVFGSYRGGYRYLPSMALSLLAIVLVVGALSISILLLPVAGSLAVRWQFYGQAAILDDARPFTRSLRASWDATRGKWWHAFALSVGFQILGVLPGPLVGILVLIFGGSRVEFANIVSSGLYVVFLPLSVIGLTMAYHHLKGEPVIAPEQWPPWRAAAETGPETRGQAGPGPAAT